MCLVKVEKMPKLQTACTTVDQRRHDRRHQMMKVQQARKSWSNCCSANHPLDCPVCDAGGECELQDMTFSYGAAESKYIEAKNHKEEQQWSPVVYFDRPRCILCYRCVRVCGEGMDVWALGVQNRGVGSVIAPNKEDHLECEECGMCIDICPVGALTSGAYRYKTRPWEMKHVGTICTHCGDGCKTTLGVRRSDTGMEIVRGDNRDKSGINGDFLCIKGRYAFDFAKHEERLTQPLIRKNGKLTASHLGRGVRVGRQDDSRKCAIKDGGAAIGVIGSNRTTNEETYLLSEICAHRAEDQQRRSPPHRRLPCLRCRAPRQAGCDCQHARRFNAPAILLIGNDPTNQHPLLAWQIRNNVRLHRARLYVINSAAPSNCAARRQPSRKFRKGRGKLAAFLAGDDAAADALGSTQANAWTTLRDKLRAEANLVISSAPRFAGTTSQPGRIRLIDRGREVHLPRRLLEFARRRRHGLYPDLLPGYHPLSATAAVPRGMGRDSASTPDSTCRR